MSNREEMLDMSGIKAGLLYLLFPGLFGVALLMAQNVELHGKMPEPALIWMLHEVTIATAIGAAIGGAAEVFIASNYHQNVSFIDKPNGLGGVMSRVMFNFGGALMIVPALLEWFMNAPTFNTVLFISFLFTTCAPQMIILMSKKFAVLGASKIEGFEMKKTETTTVVQQVETTKVVPINADENKKAG